MLQGTMIHLKAALTVGLLPFGLPHSPKL